MAISRGSVRHRLVENIVDFFHSIVRPSILDAASYSEQEALKAAIQKNLDVTNVALFPFARTGVHAVLRSLNLPPKSKILMTPITIGPMVEVIESLGHQVVFVDIETVTFGPCLIDLHRKVQAGARCFLMTHLFGYVSKVDQAVKICRDAGVFVIEDISHNLGAELNGIALGKWGDAAVYSASLLKYVDGYNGAFVATDDPQLGAALDRESDSLVLPNRGRIRAVVIKTLIWNCALGRWLFKYATWPALKALKALRYETFERLVGPGIPFIRAASLPRFYFEKITSLQCKAMLRNISKLSTRIRARRDMANRLNLAIYSLCSDRMGCEKKTEIERAQNNTYWQFVVPVRSTSVSREILFSIGVETNTTNLRDLAFEDGIELPGARALKERFIFIPLHDYLKESDYRKIVLCLLDSHQFVCKSVDFSE